MKHRARAHNPHLNLEDYPYLRCREHHYWRPYDGVLDLKARRGYRVEMCEYCGTKKTTVFILDARREDYRSRRSSYRHPRDYRLPGGLDSHDRSLVVLENFIEELESLTDAKTLKGIRSLRAHK